MTNQIVHITEKGSAEIATLNFNCQANVVPS